MNIYPQRTQQSGVVLIISLIMLLLLTLIGVTGMQVTGLEEKMAGNSKDRNIAFQAAETALRGGEAYLNNLVTLANFNGGTPGYINEATADPDYYASATWTSNSVTYASGLAGLNTQPRYIIKYVGVQGDDLNAGLVQGGYGQRSAGTKISIFRVTSRATGGRDSTQVILQSYYGKRF